MYKWINSAPIFFWYKLLRTTSDPTKIWLILRGIYPFIYMYLHCDWRSLWSATTLDTLIIVYIIDSNQCGRLFLSKLVCGLSWFETWQASDLRSIYNSISMVNIKWYRILIITLLLNSLKTFCDSSFSDLLECYSI